MLGAGVLLEFFSWPSVFGLNIALAAIAFIGTLLVVPESADPRDPRLDRGGALSVAALVALVYSVIQAPTAGSGSAQTLTGLGIGLAILAAFIVYELREQIIRGDSALIAAVSIVPMAVTLPPAARLAPALAARFGARRICAGGLLLSAAALAAIAQVGHTTPYWQLASGLLVLGVGMGAAMTPATSNITEALPPARQGVASAINDLSELGRWLDV